MILKLEALLRRIQSNHPSRRKMEEELAKCYAGFRGEQAIDYHLSLLEGDYQIFQDIRLPYKETTYFQLDFLLVTDRFLLIMEVKNITGTLFFDQSFHQLIRTANEKEEAFADPVLQVKKHKQQLQTWLKNNKLPSIPIETLVVISNPSTLIKTAPQYKEIYRLVTHAANLSTKIHSINNRFLNKSYEKNDLRKIIRLLQKQHTDPDYDILQRFQIVPIEIETGVLCPECFISPLTRKKGKWLCSNCESLFQNAHIQALIDYRLLIGPTITNKQVRDFLRIPSVSIASKLLNSLQAKSIGKYKDRTYFLSLDELLIIQKILTKTADL